MQRTIKVTISLPEDLARFIDRLASQAHRPRSQLFADLVDEKRRELLRQSMIEGYQALAAENEQFASEAMSISAEIWQEVDEN